MHSWNLLFQPDASAPAGTLTRHPGGSAPLVPLPATPAAGWTGTAGPAIEWAHWPRSTETGLPMAHVLTLWLPPTYQRRGAEYPGIALFATGGEGEDRVYTPDGADAFSADVAAARPHPMELRRRDLLEGEFALIWLTAAEIAPGPRLPIPDPRPAERPAREYVDGVNAWDDVVPTTNVWLVPRQDPNAGIAPNEDGAGGYREPVGEDATFGALFGWSHLGGTAQPVQAMPEGLTPYYLELEEIPPLNLGGGGTLQIDLESDTFDWACG